MAQKRFSGLDELMIVNPGSPNDGPTLQLGQVFIGDDGRLYQLQGLQGDDFFGELSEFYLGEDGTLYQVIRS